MQTFASRLLKFVVDQNDLQYLIEGALQAAVVVAVTIEETPMVGCHTEKVAEEEKVD